VHDDQVRVSAPASASADVNRAAAEAGITLSALRPHSISLEEIFLRMTGDESGDNGRPAAPSADRGIIAREGAAAGAEEPETLEATS